MSILSAIPSDLILSLLRNKLKGVVIKKSLALIICLVALIGAVTLIFFRNQLEEGLLLVILAVLLKVLYIFRPDKELGMSLADGFGRLKDANALLGPAKTIAELREKAVMLFPTMAGKVDLKLISMEKEAVPVVPAADPIPLQPRAIPSSFAGSPFSPVNIPFIRPRAIPPDELTQTPLPPMASPSAPPPAPPPQGSPVARNSSLKAGDQVIVTPIAGYQQDFSGMRPGSIVVVTADFAIMTGVDGNEFTARLDSNHFWKLL